MLQFQTSDYCLLVWDSDNTNPEKAIVALGKQLKEAESGYPHITILVPQSTDSFDMVQVAEKLLKNAVDLYGSANYDGTSPAGILYRMIDECLALLVNSGLSVEHIEWQMNSRLMPIKKGNENGAESD